MFELWQMVLWLIMSLLDDFDPQNNEVSKLMKSIKLVILFLHVILHKNE